MPKPQKRVTLSYSLWLPDYEELGHGGRKNMQTQGEYWGHLLTEIIVVWTRAAKADLWGNLEL